MKYMRNLSFKVRIFVYIFSIVLIIIVALSTLLYVNVKNEMDSETIENSQNTIVQLKNSTEIMLNEVDHYLNQLAFNSQLQTFANTYDESTYKDIQDVYDSVNDAKSASIYMTSCYIYYFDSGKVLAPADTIYMDLNSISCRDFIQKVLQQYKNEKAARQFNFYVIDDGDHANTLTIVKPVNIYSNTKQPVALLIVTIDSNYFSDLLDSIKINKMASVYITSPEGDVISIKNKQSNDFFEHLDKNTKATIDANKAGAFTAKIGESPCMVSFATSDLFNWKYFYIIPTSEIDKKIEFVKNFAIWLSISCLALGALVSFVFSRRIYNPISKLVGIFRQNVGASGKAEGDEISYIDRSIKNLISSNKGLQESLKENMPVMRNSFLLRILNNEIRADESLPDKMEFYSLNILQNCWYGVSIFIIDQNEALMSGYSEERKGMLEVYQRDLIASLASREQDLGIELARTPANELVLVFSIIAQSCAQAEQRMRGVVDKAHKGLAEDMAFTMTAGAGGVCANLQDIHISYKDASRALAYRVIRGSNAVISIGDVPQMRSRQYEYPYDIERELFGCLKQGYGEKIMAVVDRYFDYSQNSAAESIDMKYAFFHLLDSTIKCLAEMSVSVNDIFPGSESPYKSLTSCETVQDARQWFRKLFSQTIEYINMKRDGKGDEIVSRVKEYIMGNFKNPELSLDMISGHLHFSSSYLGKLFRESTGKSIKESIIEKRVEEAMRMLRQPNIKIKEISVGVGYPNERSFINIFKKYSNETPGDYRDHYLKKLV